jgi:hypothetical protein
MTNVIRLVEDKNKERLRELKVQFQNEIAACIALEGEYQVQLATACATAKKRSDMRLKAARTLAELRRAVEADGIAWWGWFKTNLLGIISRQDWEKLLRVGGSSDPEQALAAQRERDRLHKRAQRERECDPVIEAELLPSDSAGVSGRHADDSGSTEDLESEYEASVSRASMACRGLAAFTLDPDCGMPAITPAQAADFLETIIEARKNLALVVGKLAALAKKGTAA